MTTLMETTQVYRWLQSRLDSLATGGAWQDIAPNNIASPFIVYSLVSGLDVSGAAHVHLWQDGVYLVQVLGTHAQVDAVVAAADAITNALDLVSGNTPSATIMRSAREEDIAYSELIGGVLWMHIGARWRIYTRKT